MANIDIATLRDDILDRMDNEVVGQRLPESLRQKLKSPKRVTRAINQGLVVFVASAPAGAVPSLVDIVSLSADTDIGIAGVAGGVKTYLWPSTAFSAREDGGVLRVILNDKEYEVSAGQVSSLSTLRHMGCNPFYGDTHEAFFVEINENIYSMESVEVKARIITEPEDVNDSNQYGTAASATLPVTGSYFTALSDTCFSELLKMGMIMQSPQPEPEPEPEPQE